MFLAVAYGHDSGMTGSGSVRPPPDSYPFSEVGRTGPDQGIGQADGWACTNVSSK